MHRSATSQSCRQRISIPVPIQQIQNRKEILLSRKHTRSGHRSLSGLKEVSTPFRQTGVTYSRNNNVYKNFSAKQINKPIGFLHRNFNQNNKNSIFQRKGHESIPLRLLNMQKFSEGDESTRQFQQINNYNNQFRKRQFLKKGTAINKAIMYNVLKSKCNKNIVESSNSYINHQNNDFLGAAVYDQVPRGLRDVIGPQQMLRMSNIFTGGTINSTNLHKKVNQIIARYHQTREQPAQQQQGMTLKSIKRW